VETGFELAIGFHGRQWLADFQTNGADHIIAGATHKGSQRT
jgi:hypothetical protein